MVTHYTTDFSEVIDKLRKYYTLISIADMAGMASPGHVADLHSGRKKTVGYDTGVRLMAEYTRILKSEAKNNARKISLEGSHITIGKQADSDKRVA